MPWSIWQWVARLGLWQGVDSAYDVNVRSHFLLRSAQAAGIQQAVYCSSMSVYADLRKRYFQEEKSHLETALYGFTKWLVRNLPKCLAKMGNSYECSSSLPSYLKEKWMRETQQGILQLRQLMKMLPLQCWQHSN